MGNTESNVTSGVKKQAGVSTQKLYKLVNLKGGGLLVDMMSKKRKKLRKCREIKFFIVH